MAQVTDRTVAANPTGFDMRTELNNIIAALESDNSGSSEPLNPVPYMKWLDTSDATYYYYKDRNHDNTAWLTLFRYTVATKIMEVVSNGVVLSQTNIANEIHNATSKETPVDADEIGIWDSVSSTLKKLTWSNLNATLKTYFDTLYQSVLVSGTNIKTINSTSILGSGDLVVSAPSASQTGQGIIEIATDAEIQAGTDTVRAITPAGFRNASLGQGQTWKDVTASRVLGTTYTNSTGKPILINVTTTNTTSTAFLIATVSGVEISMSYGQGSGNGSCSCTLIIQNGTTYAIKASTGTATLQKWNELR